MFRKRKNKIVLVFYSDIFKKKLVLIICIGERDKERKFFY